MKPGIVANIMGLTVVMALALGLAIGCGGDDDNGGNGGGGDGGGGGSADTPDEYAELVCGALADRVGELEGVFGAEADFEDPEQLKDAINEAQPVIEDLASDLGDIDPPSDIKEFHTDLVSTMELAAEVMGKLGDALDKPLEEAMQELEGLTADIENVQDPAQAFEDLPDEYREAFEANENCQGAGILE